jgi:chitinase
MTAHEHNAAIAGAIVYENTTSGSSYSYDSASKEFVSYDSPNIVKQKAQYVIDKGLSGSMYWEASSPLCLRMICY